MSEEDLIFLAAVSAMAAVASVLFWGPRAGKQAQRRQRRQEQAPATTNPGATQPEELPKDWPERRPLATRHDVRKHARACAAIDHVSGSKRANPYAPHTEAFVLWAIHYAEARELLTHTKATPCKPNPQ